MFDVTLKTKTSLEVLSHFENDFLKNEDSIIKVIQDIYPDIEDDISIFEGSINFTEETSPYDFLVIILQWYYEVCEIDYQIVYSPYHKKYQLQTITTHDLKCMYQIECKGSENLKHIPQAYEAFSYVISTIKRKTQGDMQCVDGSSLTEMELDSINARLDDYEHEDAEELEALEQIRALYSKGGFVHEKMNALVTDMTSCTIKIKSKYKFIDRLNHLVDLCNDINLVRGDLTHFYDHTAEPGDEGIHLSETIMIVWDEGSIMSESHYSYLNESLNNQYECCIKEFTSNNEEPSPLPNMVEHLLQETIEFLKALDNDRGFSKYVAERNNNVIPTENDVRCLQEH